MKCKNCGKETENNNIYCSYKCRNIYVNKNIRDYSKMRETKLEQTKKRKEEYYKNPKKCKKCDAVINYDKKQNDFCSQSCSASYTNKNRKGLKYNITIEGKKALQQILIKNKKTNKEKYKDIKIEYYKNKKRCKHCNKIIPYRKRNNTFCNIDCKKEYQEKNMDILKLYKKKTKFNFSLNNYPEEFDFKLIEKYGWYSPSNSRKPNLNGVSRDHMISVVDGFNNNITPELLAHPANCKLMIHTNNISKNSKSSITIDELKERIKKWNNKYIISS